MFFSFPTRISFDPVCALHMTDLHRSAEAYIHRKDDFRRDMNQCVNDVTYILNCVISLQPKYYIFTRLKFLTFNKHKSWEIYFTLLH